MKYKVLENFTYENFVAYLKIKHKNINFQNFNYISDMYMFVKNPKINKVMDIEKEIKNFFYSKVTNKNNLKGTASVERFMALGYSLDESKKLADEVKKRTFVTNKEYWINKGFSETDAVQKVKEHQSTNVKKGLKHTTKQELIERSVWCVEHWLKKGLSLHEAKNKVLEFNGSSRSFYKTDEEYEISKKQNSKRIKKCWNDGVYDLKLKSFESKKVSNEEIEYFKFLKEHVNNKIVHTGFGINVRKISKFHKYFISDGYLKTKDGIILFEYDGTYWHNEKNDKKRDFEILIAREDIVGIIRINDIFNFKHTHEYKTKQINDAIKNIKNKKEKRIVIYESI